MPQVCKINLPSAENCKQCTWYLNINKYVLSEAFKWKKNFDLFLYFDIFVAFYLKELFKKTASFLEEHIYKRALLLAIFQCAFCLINLKKHLLSTLLVTGLRIGDAKKVTRHSVVFRKRAHFFFIFIIHQSALFIIDIQKLDWLNLLGLNYITTSILLNSITIPTSWALSGWS